MRIHIITQVVLHPPIMKDTDTGLRYEYERDVLRIMNGTGDMLLSIDKKEIIEHKEMFRSIGNVIGDIIQDHEVEENKRRKT